MRGPRASSLTRNAPRQEVIVMLLDGVARIARGTKDLTADEWEEPVCGYWTSHQLARHLLSQSRNHHHWLDAAISGNVTSPYDHSEIDEQNDLAVESLSAISGHDAITEFVRTAGRYANRVAEHWDKTLGSDHGLTTAGQHCALIALEYHLHAWDLVQRTEPDHQPPRVKHLLAAVGSARVAQARGADKLRTGASYALRRRFRPWEYLLAQSGRRADANGDERVTKSDPVIDLRGDGELTLPITDGARVASD